MHHKLLYLVCVFLILNQASAQDTIVLISGKVIPVQSVDLQDYTIAFRKMPKPAKDPGTSAHSTAPAKKSKLRTIDPERVFSVKYRDGSERIIYTPDTLDPLEFTPEQMRLFIYGEQDAARFYKNNLNKGIGFGFGAASGLLGFYGLAGPPLYATIMGSFTPDLNKRREKQMEMEQARHDLELTAIPATPADPESNAAYQAELNKYTAANEKYEKLKKHHYFSDVKLLDKNEYREGYERKARDRKIRNAMLSGLAGFVVMVVGLPVIY